MNALSQQHSEDKTPTEIIYFERCFLLSLMPLFFILAHVYHSLFVAHTLDIPQGETELKIVCSFVMILGLMLWSILAISRKRARLARYILVIMFVFVARFAAGSVSIITTSFFGGAITFMFILQCIGLYFLFSNNGLRWCSRRLDSNQEDLI